MNFTDLFFIFLFAPVCIISYFISNNIMYRNVLLLVFSLIFYAWGKPVFVLLILFGALVNYALGLAISTRREKTSGKVILALALIFDIGLLALFKYTGFFIENINAVAGCSIPVPDIPLPLGISFFTFEVISYLLDVWWEKTDAEKSFFRFLLYVSLFPNITAGPIVRYTDISDSLGARRIGISDVSEGICRVVTGLAKKVIIADTLSTVVGDFIGENVASATVVGCWYGVIVYSLQMYFDFSGYSDMAIGLARIFGFRYRENFNYPFVSKTVAEFWQRWHISLGSFFRDYLLYVPIFGQARKFGGLFLVWFCTGLWHGASWNYVIWGLYFGVFMLIETLLGKKRIKKIPEWIRHIYTMLVVIVGFGIFYETDLGRLGTLLKGLIGLNGCGFCDSAVAQSAANNAFLIAAAILFSLPVVPFIRKKLCDTEGGTKAVGVVTVVLNVALLCVCAIILVNSTNNPFIYANY